MPAWLFGQTMALFWEQVLYHHVEKMQTEMAEADETNHVGVWSARYMTFEAIEHRQKVAVQESEWDTVEFTTCFK